MKRKGLLLLTLSIICMNGCGVKEASSQKKYAISTYITKDMNVIDERGSSTFLLENEYTPYYMKQIASDVAIISIIRVDHADMNFSSFTAATYGECLIQNVIQGKLKSGQTINYVRPGGMVSIEEFEKADNPDSINKRNYLRQQEGVEVDKKNTYYDLRIDQDIHVEVGKTYLAYLYYHKNKNQYEIIGLENGLREINVPQEKKCVQEKDFDIEELQIKNNTTNTYESLSTYMDTYFKPE